MKGEHLPPLVSNTRDDRRTRNVARNGSSPSSLTPCPFHSGSPLNVARQVRNRKQNRERRSVYLCITKTRKRYPTNQQTNQQINQPTTREPTAIPSVKRIRYSISAQLTVGRTGREPFRLWRYFDSEKRKERIRGAMRRYCTEHSLTPHTHPRTRINILTRYTRTYMDASDTPWVRRSAAARPNAISSRKY